MQNGGLGLSDFYLESTQYPGSSSVELVVSIDPGCVRHLFRLLTLKPTVPSATQSSFMLPLDRNLYRQSVSQSASIFFFSGEEHQWTETPVHSSLLPREVSLVLGGKTPLSVKLNLWKPPAANDKPESFSQKWPPRMKLYLQDY